MFKIEENLDAAEDEPKKTVVDHERNVSLDFVAGPGRAGEWGHGRTFKLVWQGRTIALVVGRTEKTDPQTGQIYYLSNFQSFGGRGYGLGRKTFESYVFQNDEERHEAKMLAVEALLLMSGAYSGDTKPEGYDRVEYDGRIFTKKDFGMG